MISMPSYKQFTLLLLNLLKGICKETGEISIEKQVVNELVQSLPELKEMQTIYHQFRKTINGDSISDLEYLCTSIKNTELKGHFLFSMDSVKIGRQSAMQLSIIGQIVLLKVALIDLRVRKGRCMVEPVLSCFTERSAYL